MTLVIKTFQPITIVHSLELTLVIKGKTLKPACAIQSLFIVEITIACATEYATIQTVTAHMELHFTGH